MIPRSTRFGVRRSRWVGQLRAGNQCHRGSDHVVSDESASIRLVSVNVGLPGIIGERHGEPIISGIRKTPVETTWVEVTSTGITGDGQADLFNHGGAEKAVYVYTIDHLPLWSREPILRSPTVWNVRENLTVQGIVENQVFIGDRWQWGEVVLEVCQPRYPCYKLATVLDRPSVVREMVGNSRTGWYMRVLNSGEAPGIGPIQLVERGSGRVTVIDAHQGTGCPTQTRNSERESQRKRDWLRLARGVDRHNLKARGRDLPTFPHRLTHRFSRNQEAARQGGSPMSLLEIVLRPANCSVTIPKISR